MLEEHYQGSYESEVELFFGKFLCADVLVSTAQLYLFKESLEASHIVDELFFSFWNVSACLALSNG